MPPPEPWGLPPVWLTASEAKASVVAGEVARQAGVGVVMGKEAGEKLVSVSFEGCSGEEAFRTIAGQVGLGVRYRGGTVEYVEADRVVEGFGVLSSGYYEVEEASNAVRALVGSEGTVSIMGERLIVSGTREALRRVQVFGSQLESGPDGWHLDVRLVRVSRKLRRELGIDWTVEGSVRAELDAGRGMLPGATPVVGARARAVVAAVAAAAESSSDAELVYSAPVWVLEGETATLRQGERVPIPRRTVSDAGTVTTTGVDYIDAGFDLRVFAKRVPGGVRLELRPSLSSISGFVEGYPIVSRSEVESVAVVRSGEWMVLGGLEVEERLEERAGLPGALESVFGSRRVATESGSTLLVLIRAVRVHAGGRVSG